MNPLNKNSITNKVLITVFSMVAELERDFISERTKAGLDARKEKGIKLGKPKELFRASMYDADKEKSSIFIGSGCLSKKSYKLTSGMENTIL